jgi:hypothetical protein
MVRMARPDGARRGVRLGSGVALSTIRVGYLKAAFDQDRPFKALDDAALDALRGMGVSPVAVEMPTGFPTARSDHPECRSGCGVRRDHPRQS